MKYTIEGFSQERAVELGLSAEDLVVLRWFVDFWPSDYMVKMEHDGKKFGLVNYKGFIEQMPIVAGTKKTVARKFGRLVDAGVLENATIKKGGSYSVYRFGKNYESLIESVKQSEGGVGQNCLPLDKSVQPYGQDCPTGLDNFGYTKTSLLNTNLNNTNIVADAPFSVSKKRFVKPTVEEVAEYCKSRNNTIDPEAFLDYYESKGWLIGKTPMKDWKAAVRTWEKHHKNDSPLFTEENTQSKNTPAAPSFNEVSLYAEEINIPAPNVLEFFDFWCDKKWLTIDGKAVDWKEQLQKWK